MAVVFCLGFIISFLWLGIHMVNKFFRELENELNRKRRYEAQKFLDDLKKGKY